MGIRILGERRVFSVEMIEGGDGAERLRRLVEPLGPTSTRITPSFDSSDPQFARFLRLEVEAGDVVDLERRLNASDAIADIVPEPEDEPPFR